MTAVTLNSLKNGGGFSMDVVNELFVSALAIVIAIIIYQLIFSS